MAERRGITQETLPMPPEFGQLIGLLIVVAFIWAAIEVGERIS